MTAVAVIIVFLVVEVAFVLTTFIIASKGNS